MKGEFFFRLRRSVFEMFLSLGDIVVHSCVCLHTLSDTWA